MGMGFWDTQCPRQRHGCPPWGRVFLQQVSLAVQGLNSGGLSLTCFPSCSWYKVARLGTTPLSWGCARGGWFVPQLKKYYLLMLLFFLPFLFSSLFCCSLPCLGVVLSIWDADAMGCIHIRPRNLGLHQAEHGAEKGKCKDPAEWVEAPENMGNLG